MGTLRYAFEERQLLENFIHQKNGGSGESMESIQLGSTVSYSGIKSNNAELPKNSTADAKLCYPKPSSACTKRTRTNFQLQVSVCQVRGCKKDLSLSKDYYKRHKVCDIHSKTAVVVVSGVQQRFCQQCSRFHMLDQFDGDKRSCRKRLAGHNKRRRKPQLLAHLGSAFLQPSASMLFSKTLPGGIFSPQCHELVKHNTLGKSKNKLPYEVSHLAVPVQFGFSLPQSALHLNGIVKQYPSSDLLELTSSVQNISPAINSPSALFLLSGLNTELIEQYSRYANGMSSGH